MDVKVEESVKEGSVRVTLVTTERKRERVRGKAK